MAPSRAAVRPLGSIKASLRQVRLQRAQRRWQHNLAELQTSPKPSLPLLGTRPKKEHKPIPIYAPPPSTWSNCKDPVKAIHDAQIAAMDPTGARTRLFSKGNPEAVRIGDILLVRQKNGEPFAGVCLSIRKRGIDTSILLRNHLTKVGVEMWFKIYSPNVAGIEVVQRKEKRARRNKLYYMRKPEHDIGSVDAILRQYQRQRAMLGSSSRGKNANQGKKKQQGQKKK
ncbi:ribosomal protein L19 [Verruconis gallopava]|uniref:Ribosomal protein L19 n=1 Tax=Verruconis gallopava TaxID=253628 RepID=A0A0D1XXA9_9PEZI|nr:ribosomal protein L19 [Verruconis gallopava]KIW07411.1 ribosomal protein L19 [Verruconis gallopava]